MDLFKNAMYDGFIVTEDLIIDEEVTNLKETSEMCSIQFDRRFDYAKKL